MILNSVTLYIGIGDRGVSKEGGKEHFLFLSKCCPS